MSRVEYERHSTTFRRRYAKTVVERVMLAEEMRAAIAAGDGAMVVRLRERLRRAKAREARLIRKGARR